MNVLLINKVEMIAHRKPYQPKKLDAYKQM